MRSSYAWTGFIAEILRKIKMFLSPQLRIKAFNSGAPREGFHPLDVGQAYALETSDSRRDAEHIHPIGATI
jgi:hypothetical protein